MSELRAIVAAVRGALKDSGAALTDIDILRSIDGVCTELLAGARQTENWFDEIVRRVVTKLSAVRVQ